MFAVPVTFCPLRAKFTFVGAGKDISLVYEINVCSGAEISAACAVVTIERTHNKEGQIFFI